MSPGQDERKGGDEDGPRSRSQPSPLVLSGGSRSEPESKDEEDPFEVALQEKKRQRGVKLDTELDAEALRELVVEFKALVKMRIRSSVKLQKPSMGRC